MMNVSLCCTFVARTAGVFDKIGKGAIVSGNCKGEFLTLDWPELTNTPRSKVTGRTVHFCLSKESFSAGRVK